MTRSQRARTCLAVALFAALLGRDWILHGWGHVAVAVAWLLPSFAVLMLILAWAEGGRR